MCCSWGEISVPGGSSRPILTSTHARFTSKQQNLGGPVDSHPYRSRRQADTTKTEPKCSWLSLPRIKGCSEAHRSPTISLSTWLSDSTPGGGRNGGIWEHISNLSWCETRQKFCATFRNSKRRSEECLAQARGLMLDDNRCPNSGSPFSWLRVCFLSTVLHRARTAPRVRSCSGPCGKALTAFRTW